MNLTQIWYACASGVCVCSSVCQYPFVALKADIDFIICCLFNLSRDAKCAAANIRSMKALADRKSDRKTDSQTDGQADRQTDRLTVSGAATLSWVLFSCSAFLTPPSCSQRTFISWTKYLQLNHQGESSAVFCGQQSQTINKLKPSPVGKDRNYESVITLLKGQTLRRLQ